MHGFFLNMNAVEITVFMIANLGHNLKFKISQFRITSLKNIILNRRVALPVGQFITP